MTSEELRRGSPGTVRRCTGRPSEGRRVSGCFCEHGQLVRAQVDHAVGHHAVDARIVERECLDAAFTELDLCQSGAVGDPAGLVELLLGEVDPVDVAGRTGRRSA